ncbi:dnaJ homolog subfamily C member 10-like [Fopius arisanus]|uniref:DnaJ homolog subfamily C member 10-like n=1 Tax=Fopius arisanus TaxID=64838 RepID=A0A9R1TJP6_9HYME|nr:PREDICTED: dnaJ homolog subfamily C member 10-like [Fopius arisanus]
MGSLFFSFQGKLDDPDAHIKFIKYTTAYEVLKDPDLRKKYDLYGEEGLNGQNTQQNYRSWSYYQENFGIYDDDPQVVTLNKNDYHDNVINSEKIWMINFYSPMCSHCRTLAPSWRKIAKDFEGVIRVGAVNCEDDWSLCRQLGIQSYPTLLFYPKNSQHGIRFTSRKNYDEISEFIMSRLDVNLEKLSQSSFHRLIKDSTSRKNSWLIFTCGKNRECFEEEDQLKISAIFENILNIGVFDCDRNRCDDVLESSTSAVFLSGDPRDSKSPVLFGGLEDIDSLVHEVLEQLPEPQEITAEEFERIKNGLASDSEGWLMCFYIGHATELDLLLKRLPGIIQDVNLGKVNCGRHNALCSSLSINRYPMWGVLKPSGAFELNHGKEKINDIAKFAENSMKAQNVWALSASKILSILQRKTHSEVWFLDWYAPWCPPCLQFLPELRKASLHFQKSTIHFGTVDCTVHSSICRQYNIRSYPTAMLINGSSTHQFTLQKTARNIIEFIKEFMNPTVMKLNSNNFYDTLGKKSPSNLWVVDYFAPWCGPCQQLAPEWTSVAKVLHLLPYVKVASVDCEENGNLCRSQGIRSYPTIRLYPMGSEGLNQIAMYSGNRDAISLMRWIIQFSGISVKEFSERDLERKVINNNKRDVWVIDYYAPWCGHCQVLEPQFAVAAKMLEGRARFGRLNCEDSQAICGRAGVSAYPTVIVYRDGDKRLNGGKRLEGTTAEGIRDEVEMLMKERERHDEL